MSTFLQLQEECLAYGFGASYRARFKVWLNEAQDVAARRTQMRELFSTTSITLVAGTSAYTLPADFARLDSLTDTSNQYSLEPSYAWAFDLLGAQTGTPTVYMLDANGLNVWPTPSSGGTLRLRYYADPTDMTADTDEPLLAPAYQGALIAYAVSRAYRSEDDPQQAASFWADWERGLQQMASDRQHELADGARQVPGMWNQRHAGQGMH